MTSFTWYRSFCAQFKIKKNIKYKLMIVFCKYIQKQKWKI